jgi:RNA polymerase sigma-70 factor (ECF subfamily)
MYRIALNTAIAHLNIEKRKGTHLPVDEFMLNQSDSNDNGKNEQIEALYAQIKKLNTIEKAIILLYLEGNSYEEIASITGFTTTNVGTRLGRVRQKLITARLPGSVAVRSRARDDRTGTALQCCGL